MKEESQCRMKLTGQKALHGGAIESAALGQISASKGLKLVQWLHSIVLTAPHTVSLGCAMSDALGHRVSAGD